MQLSSKAAKIIFLITAIVLLGLSYILYHQIDSLLESQKQLNRTTQLKLKLEQTLAALVDTETAQRGFLLTRDSVFLEPYNGAYDKSKKLLEEIRDLASNGEYDQAKFNALQTFIELRFGTFTHVFERFKDPSLSASDKRMHLLRSKAAMDSIRHYVQDISGRADEMLAEREQINKKYNFLTPLFAVLLIAFAIVILTFSYEKIVEQLTRTKKLLFRLKKLNSKLKQKNHQLELSNKELDSFTYIASHDLKEPLRKIMTYTSMIEEKDDAVSYKDNLTYFRKIKDSAERMQNLLNDLLQYSHTHMSEKKFEQVDLNKVLNEVVQNLDEEITEAGAHIHYQSLPVIKGMPFQIRQLFENLLTNSLKYKQEKALPVITIDSKLVDEKEISDRYHKVSKQYIKIDFKDNGLGFDQSHAERVFRLFQRLHTKDGYKGTGIGLTICKKVVDNHYGFIQAISKVNTGTTFEIYFPYHQ
ncbi:MAG TPA: CHASE3 domain-containing protein [Flavipsychrobacter sp.]|nr:CHASE3 domain-containing protein [Flavipsychrobacter sp.]